MRAPQNGRRCCRRIKNFGSKLLHGGQTGGDGTTTTTTTEHHVTSGVPGQTATHTSTTGGPVRYLCAVKCD